MKCSMNIIWPLKKKEILLYVTWMKHSDIMKVKEVRQKEK